MVPLLLSGHFFFWFASLAPTITGISPQVSGTGGGSTLVVYGSSFGVNPVTTVGGILCSSISYNLESIQCTIPAGQGAQKSVVVSNLGQYSAPYNFGYLPPSISVTRPYFDYFGN